ncbi:hypothetical protein YC2023_091886 [Brassica napus]
MALNTASSEEFSFPLLASQDSSQTSGSDSPPLWKHSPEKTRLGYDDGRLIIGRYNDDDGQRKSFSYVETRSLWNVNAEEKMDMLWEELNEEAPPPPRSQSLRIDLGGDKRSSLFPDESSAVGCGMKLTKKRPSTKMKMSTNVLVLMRVLKKILVIRSSSQRSPAKTNPPWIKPAVKLPMLHSVMAPTRNLIRDEELGAISDDDDSPSGKRSKLDRFPLSRWELALSLGVFLVFSSGLFCIYITMPAAEFGKLKLPRSISDLRSLKDNLANYANEYPAQFVLGYCATYIFMQTFMIPGTIFMSLLAGALFGVIKGVILVVFNATAGATCCFFLSKLIGRPLITWLWPDKLRFFQAEIGKRRDKLLNYMLFLRITPTLPNLFINLASPIVDVPFHVFFLATLVGLIPAAYITVRAGLAIGDLKSVKDLYDFKTLSVLFLIGFISILPTILKRKKIYE